MIIGILELDLRFFSGNSLKEKRRLLKRLIFKIRNNFNVSVSEIGHQDLWQRTELGISLITTEMRFAQKVLNRILELIKKERGISLINSKMEFL